MAKRAHLQSPARSRRGSDEVDEVTAPVQTDATCTILTPESVDDHESSVQQIVPRRSGRKSDGYNVNYNMKYHPMDLYTRPLRAARVTGLSVSELSNKHLRSKNNLSDTDESETFKGDSESDSDVENDMESCTIGDDGHSVKHRIKAPRISRGLKTPKLDPHATRRSQRSAARKAVIYDARYHPQDWAIPGYRGSARSKVRLSTHLYPAADVDQDGIVQIHTPQQGAEVVGPQAVPIADTESDTTSDDSATVFEEEELDISSPHIADNQDGAVSALLDSSAKEPLSSPYTSSQLERDISYVVDTVGDESHQQKATYISSPILDEDLDITSSWASALDQFPDHPLDVIR